MDLEMGAVDAIAMDVIVAGYQIEQRDDGSKFKILDEDLASEEYGIGFKKGNEELRDQVQATLEEMAKDGKLEEISNAHEGVERTYAMQAGRELHVMVEPEKISDAEATVLAHDIAKQIEDEMEYPGQVRVVVIRESRALGIAK